MLVRVKNRTAHAILLKDANGEVIQLNAGVTREIDDSFLIDYDTKAIQLIQKKTVTVEATSPVLEVKASESKESKESKKKS